MIRPRKDEAPTLAGDEASKSNQTHQGKNDMINSKAATSFIPALAVFKFNENDVRTVTRDGEPWFVAVDICKALGYLNTSKAVGDHLDADEKGVTTGYTLGGEQKLTVINESGLYALVLRSRKPEARKFAKWVTSEVLPAIRKTGKFDVRTHTGPLTKEMRETIKSLVIERAKALPYGKQAGAIIKAWSALKSHFGVSYKEIPCDKYTEAVSLVARMQVEWEVVEEVPILQYRPLEPGKLVVDRRKLAAIWVDLGRLRQRLDGLGVMESDLPPEWWQANAISSEAAA